MKIGDRCFVHGYIDEIRKDTVIVRNDGGYFGTIPSEVTGGLPPVQSEIIRCKDCKFYTAYDYTGKLMCKRIGKGMILPKPEDYCSYAERWEE